MAWSDVSVTQMRGKSFGEILDMNRGAGLGFDTLRMALAVMIMLAHCSGATGNSGLMNNLLNTTFDFGAHAAAVVPAGAAGPARAVVEHGTVPAGLGRPITLSHVPMFFALSGFLVAGSALRTRNVFRFLGLRVLRILPALFVEVTLSALLIGAFFTTLPLDRYFSHPEFWNYFKNIYGDVRFVLPGVFDQNRGQAVNSNLWTLPYEFECYILMTIAIVTGLVFRPKWLLAITVAIALVLGVRNSFFGASDTLKGPLLSYCFAVGVIMYLFRYRIKFHEGYFLAAGVASYLLMMSFRTAYLWPIPLAYVTMFIGLYPFPQFKLLKSGDYSYGVYLYGFPVMQAWLALYPGLGDSLLMISLLSIGTTLVFAFLSWHLVEKHFLKLKRFIAPRSAKISETLHPGMDAQPGAPGEPLVPAPTNR